ncbi:Helicase SKI2W [Nosema granulosis]|uniref:Helicase SKI2W n=1 Tax=Nosema granulosis TaxID=83296 RepID=A0A9P6H4D6_9MICR|nr:Helicase SKI2W [Nosema granulosis]
MENNKTQQEIPYSVVVNKDWMPKDYDSYVNESILNIDFKPDTFQKQAFYFLSRSESVFVSAHTSSGKTLVAEYAIALAELSSSRTIYTSPIKALSNQKFYDFKQKFEDVGIITGDVQVNSTAKCLIMTTEILRNLIYKNNDLLHNTKYIIFDEVHYINDQDRGVVWEECIIMIPKHITLILLSATIPNSKEFSDWVGRTRNKCIYIISTDKRPVPLEHLIYLDREVYTLREQKKPNLPVSKYNNRQNKNSNFKHNILPYSKRSTPVGRFKIIDLANFVVRRKLTPTIFFCFSKKRCDSLVDSLSTLDLTTLPEKKQINEFLTQAINQLPQGDRSLPQILKMKNNARLGMAVHHGALLPFVKECVEILFSLNLIKLLIATETFAMGVNMPAKSVVFLSLSKIDGEAFRYLTTGEYTQMSGRAGRRGMDKVGTVLIADDKNPPINIVQKVIEGTPLKLYSQFKLSFSLILTALRSNIKIEEIMRKSYKEHSKQKNEGKDLRRLITLEDNNKRIDCEDLYQYIEIVQEISFVNELMLKKHKSIKAGDKLLLKNNTLVEVVEFKDDKLKIKEVQIDSSNIELEIENLSIVQRDLKLPHTVIIGTMSGEIQIPQIFCVLEEGKPAFSYKIEDIDDFLQTKRLKSLYQNLLKCKCLTCPEFVSHYKLAIKQKKLEDEAQSIRLKYSIDNLGMIDEYNNRILFLQKNNFYDSFITLKGRVAAEIRTVNEVLATEMIFDNEFKYFSAPAIVALFSSMINEDESEEFPFCDELKKGVERMIFHADKLTRDIENLHIPPFTPLNFTLIQAVYDWCNGELLQTIVNNYHVSEGSFVRLILRLDECCREMVTASILIEDEELEKKFTEASSLLKREIVFLPSLYL